MLGFMLTKFLAKLLGLWIVLIVLAVALNRTEAFAAINALFSDSALMFVTGTFTLVIGLAIVVGHNRWSGATAVVVTLCGWASLLKGLLLLALPASTQAAMNLAAHFEQFFYGWAVAAILLGAYLIYGGFAPERAANS